MGDFICVTIIFPFPFARQFAARIICVQYEMGGWHAYNNFTNNTQKLTPVKQ